MPITLSGVFYAYPGHDPILSSVDLTIADGESVALTGPSGSGKSTVLQLIGGLLQPTRGTVERSCSVADIRWVFQAPTALGRRTALDNVALGLLTSGRSPATRAERARTTLAGVGLADRANRRASTLSGGELQRVQIARALVCAPPLVLADEPTAQLDYRSTTGVLEALRYAQSASTTLVVATHDPIVAQGCDRVLSICAGSVVPG